MPGRHLIRTWLLKVQAKGTAVLEYAREGKLSSSAKLLLSLRESISNFKEIKWRFQFLLDLVVGSSPVQPRVGMWEPEDTQQIVNRVEK